MTKLTLKQAGNKLTSLMPVSKRLLATAEDNKYFLLMNIQAEIVVVQAQLNKLLEDIEALK